MLALEVPDYTSVSAKKIIFNLIQFHSLRSFMKRNLTKDWDRADEKNLGVHQPLSLSHASYLVLGNSTSLSIFHRFIFLTCSIFTSIFFPQK